MKRVGVEELASALPARERKELYKRITRALTVDTPDRQSVVHKKIQNERRAALIAADMSRLTLWERIIFWFRRLFSSGGEEEVFVRFRLSQLKKEIREYQAEYVDFTNNRILPPLAQAVYELSAASRPTVEFFHTVLSKTELLRSVLDDLLEKKVPDSKNSLYDFCDAEELQRIYRDSDSKGEVKKTVLQRIATFIDDIPVTVLEEIEHDLKHLYVIKRVATFDYESFLAKFRPGEGQGEKNARWERAAATDVIEQLEELYVALYSAGKIRGEPVVYPELAEQYASIASRDERESEVYLRQAIIAVTNGAKAIKEKVPLVEIIRYFRDDPYHRFYAYTPRPRLRDFYYSSLKIKVLEELEREFDGIVEAVVASILHDLFPRGMREFQHIRRDVHYREDGGNNRRGPVLFTSLQVIDAFFRDTYRAGLREFVALIEKIAPVYGGTQIEVLDSVKELERVEERLRNLDASVAETTERGAVFLQQRNSEDSESLKSRRAAEEEKIGDESRHIIDDFIECLSGVVRSFRGILDGKHKELMERYESYEGFAAGMESLNDRLRTYIALIDETLRVLRIISRGGKSGRTRTAAAATSERGDAAEGVG